MTDPVYNEVIIGETDEEKLLAEIAQPLSFIRRVTIDVLKSLFSQKYFGENGTMKNPFLFIPDNGDNSANSPLLINAEQAEDQPLADGRYYITVDQGPTSFTRTGIGNLIGGTAGISDRGVYSSFVNTSVIVTCKAKKWRTANILAQCVATFLLTLQPLIRHRSIIHSLGDPTVSSKQMTDTTGSQSQRNQYTVEMSATLVYNWRLSNQNTEIVNQVVMKAVNPLKSIPQNC